VRTLKGKRSLATVEILRLARHGPQALRVREPASPYEWFTMPALKGVAFDLPVMGQE